jgi:NAD(P)-dependent dehydrogenase (short-subunit alcohol dehydrogenase family)
LSRPLVGKNAIITGASQGLGLEIARYYIDSGASVLMCARDGVLLQRAAEVLMPKLPSNQRLIWVEADVSDENDVNNLVFGALKEFGDLHVLVNNAGIYGPKGATEDVDWSAWKQSININLFGSVLMARAILPHFKSEKRGKIIQISGGGATAPLPFLSSYAVAKAAIVRFVETLSEEVRDYSIDVNSIAPGALNTRMLDEVIDAGPSKVGEKFYNRALEQRLKGGVPLSYGAELAVFLGSEASNKITGRLISAVWDDWLSWPEHIEELNNSDVYTLRRITGKDRNMTWGDK